MLYKYISTNSKSYESILSKKEVYFASPDQLNDPFEFRPNFVTPSKGKIKQYMRSLGASHREILKKLPYAVELFDSNDKSLEELMSAVYKKSAVLCMTPHPDNLLMWAHYGDSHRGVCIGFDINLPFDEEFGNGYPVKYQDEYPKICMTEIDLMLRDMKFGKDMGRHDEVITRSAFTKAMAWSYENEIRFYRDLRIGPGPMDFAAIKLKEVIVGASFSMDKIENISKTIRENFPAACLKKSITFSR